jgi:hypothetical protein
MVAVGEVLEVGVKVNGLIRVSGAAGGLLPKIWSRRYESSLPGSGVVLGRGRNGAIRYRWADIEAWLASLPQVD